MTKVYNVYEVHDKNGNFVIRGISRDLRPYLDNASPNLMSVYSRNGGLLNRKWFITKIGQITVKDGEDTPELIKSELAKFSKPQEQKDEEIMDYLLRQLEKYDSTCLNECPERFIKPLADEGFDCRYRKVKGIKYYGGRIDPFYVIEIVGIRKEDKHD